MLKWPLPKASYEAEYDFYSRILSWAFSHSVYRSDQEVWQVPDLWESKSDLEQLFDKDGVIFGDCDTFAQLCRHALANFNIPTRLVLCYVETGEYHAVAETPEGYVFDVRKSLLSNWKMLEAQGYKKDIMGPLCLADSPTKDDWHEAL